MKIVQWGIVGPGAIAHNFADGLKESPSGVLAAVCGRNETRRGAFGNTYSIPPYKQYGDPKQLFADPDIDAIYISTPHPFHTELSIDAMRHGKAVLCEKPAGVTAAQVTALIEVAAQQNVFFMEGLMYRCHPQIARMIGIIQSGEIGEIRHVRAEFGFSAPFDPASRLYDRTGAGGAILDVGTYPISFARLIAGIAGGNAFEDPEDLRAIGHMGASHVDESAYALLQFKSGITAECATSISRAMDNQARIVGSTGQILLPDPWMPGRDAGPSDSILQISANGETRVEKIVQAEHLFSFEAEIASQSIINGNCEAPTPAMSWQDSVGNAEALDWWRREIGYEFTSSDPAVAGILNNVLPQGLPPIPKRDIAGADRPASSLIMGCDNKDGFADGAIVWDAFMDAGGNAFDTAFLYGRGKHESALGEWIAARGVSREVVVVAKGAHSPYCTPRSIETELNQSLGRLRLEQAPIYIMHRDNPEVPVGEFVDALNRLRDAGRIGVFGGSNWDINRFEEANAYAALHGLEPMRILNNNLSLAVMERPVWNGCVTSNTPQTLAYLRSNQIMHLSWSSQARGYFLPPHLRDRLPAETGPEQCFGSIANAERRRRAETLAAEFGVSTHNVATAWVLAQAFPSFALIGPRSSGELASTLPAFTFELTPADAAWLNLERDER